MELVAELINNQFALYIPVALVLILAILVFTFGFKSTEQPPFDKLSSNSNDDRKPAGKKRKTKEKKSTANGQVTNISEKSPSKDKKSPTKEPADTPKQKKLEKQSDKNKKNEPVKNKKIETIEDIKNKKNKTKISEKPVDFDDGNWETVPTKADKKKKQDSPAKKDKKEKKTSNKTTLEIEKLAKEVVNNELREMEIQQQKENKEPEPVVEEIIVVEEKKEKKKEKKPKKEKEVSPPAPVEIKPVVEPPVVQQIAEAMTEVEPVTKKSEGAVVFDELGDVWTEAKVPKKSKKKARRDN